MDWDNYARYFKESEFADDHGDCWMEESHMDRLMIARSIANTPFSITSGCRNLTQNKLAGGKDTSDHLTGEGSDISVAESWKRFIVVNALLKAGFTRIGIGKDFIHAGSGSATIHGVIWLYD